jgi:hypothetical protein
MIIGATMAELTKSTEVNLHIDTDAEAFDNDANEYFNIPKKYFTETSEGLVLDAEIATELDWIVYETINGVANITTRAQMLTINGEQRNINPGLGGLIDEANLKK